MSITFQNIGIISGLWGVFWFMWDRYAKAPGWLLGCGLILFLAGKAIE